MKSALKWSAIVAAALIVIVIGALLIIPHFMDANRYKPELEQYVLEKTGRRLSVDGDVRLSLFPWAGVAFSGLRLGSPPSFAEKDFLTVKAFDVRVKLWPLLSKQIEVDRLVVSEPHLWLVTNRDGAVSWEFRTHPAQAEPSAPSEPDPKAELPIASLLVGELSVQNGRIQVIDHTRGSRREISELNLALRDVSFDRPVRWTLSAMANRSPVSVEGRFGPLGSTLGQGLVPLELSADAFEHLKLRIKGTLENWPVAPLIRVDVEAAEFSPRRLLAAIETPPPPTADLKVLERAAFKARVDANAKAVTVADAVLILDDSKLGLSAKVTDFARPSVTFDLHLDQIDMDRYLPPPSKAGAAPPPIGQPSGSAPQKTDYTPLRKLLLDGRARIDRLTIANARAQDVTLKIAAKDGMLSLDPFSLKLYQGTANGKTVVNVTGERPVTEAHLDLNQVQVNPLLKDVAGKDFLEGSTQARITITTTGDDPARIKQSLNGRGNLVFSDGAIVGVDLANMVRNVKTALGGEGKTGARPRTDFAELIVPFTIENGVWHTPESILKSPLLRLQASGRADLVKETLDFRVDPRVVGTIKGQGDDKDRAGLGVPVIVSGTFASPAFRPDLESLARDRLKQALSPSTSGGAPVKEKAGDLIKGLLPGKK
ncbi:MAG: AsmA family protein [Desulfobacterales bacterium]|jgi:AsmA protein|nr:AsmA family protein [Desulfobacterales bacterium]